MVSTDTPCDVMVYAAQGNDGQHALRDVLPSEGKAFGAARPYLTEWTRDGSLLAREASAIWVEYDVPSKGAAPDPFVFVCLYPDYLRKGYPHHAPIGRQDEARVRATAKEGLRWALGKAPSRQQLDVITRCTRALPDDGRMLHVVGMPHRPGGALRIGAILPYDDVPRWLQQIDWSGTKPQLKRMRKLFGGGYDYIHVQVELSTHVHNRLAFDFNLSTTPAKNPRWKQFAGAVAAECDAEPEKLDAALAWVGSERLHFDDDPIPARLDRQLFFKVSSSPDQLEAKAYLCFHPRYSLL